MFFSFFFSIKFRLLFSKSSSKEENFTQERINKQRTIIIIEICKSAHYVKAVETDGRGFSNECSLSKTLKKFFSPFSYQLLLAKVLKMLTSSHILLLNWQDEKRKKENLINVRVKQVSHLFAVESDCGEMDRWIKFQE
jgi:hypothetical protein